MCILNCYPRMNRQDATMKREKKERNHPKQDPLYSFAFIPALFFSSLGILGVLAVHVFCALSFLDCLRSAFAGADADAVFQRQNEDFAIADTPFGTGASGLHDGVDSRLDKVFIDGNLQLHLTQQVHRQFVASVHFGMPLLPAKALHVHDSEAENLDLVEGFLDGFQLRRLDDGEDEFHGYFLVLHSLAERGSSLLMLRQKIDDGERNFGTSQFPVVLGCGACRQRAPQPNTTRLAEYLKHRSWSHL